VAGKKKAGKVTQYIDLPRTDHDYLISRKILTLGKGFRKGLTAKDLS